MKGFFAVDKTTFAKACDISLNTGVAFLVLARGTGGDNSTTSWSNNAVEKYTQISRARSKKAVENLIEYGLIKRTRAGTAPRYKLPIAKNKKLLEECLWLPCTIVDSAAGEASPIERIRQTQDAMCLRLFVDLYDAQNLVESGGISREVVWYLYESKKIAESGQYTIWGFEASGPWVSWSNPITEPHKRKDLTEEEIENGKTPAVDFFRRLGCLTELGVIYWSPHLFESDGKEAEIIHPLGGENVEDELGKAANTAGLHLLSSGFINRTSEFNFTIPIPRHYERPAVIGAARLRYRPHTKLTKAWWAETEKNTRNHTQRYQALCGLQSDWQYQGEIKV